MKINDTGEAAYQAARNRGHFQDETGITGYFARIHSDLGRALDAHRQSEAERRVPCTRPTGPNTHIADAAIRIMTLSQHLGLDLENAVLQALEKGERKPVPGEIEDLEDRALNHYAARFGHPAAANFDEVIWDGHQILVQASEPTVKSILELESNGIRPEEAGEETKERMALDLAEFLIWTLAAGHQRNAKLPELIETIIAWDTAR